MSRKPVRTGQPAGPANPTPPEFRTIPISSLLPDEKNPRKALQPVDPEYGKIKTSIEQYQFLDPIIYNTRTLKIIGGHQRIQILKDSGVTALFTLSLGAYSWAFSQADLKELSPAMETAANISLNKSVGDWDNEKLVAALNGIKLDGLDIAITGFGLDDLSALSGEIEDKKLTVSDAKKTLSERFGIPPFSVLDARQGYWQDRKRAWIALGIRSEIGRGENALGFSAQCSITVGGAKPHPDSYQAKKQGKPLLFKNATVNEKGLNHYRNKEKENA